MNGNTSEMNRMLKDISIIDFTLVDLNEYLDTHPYDKQAMEYFNHYSRIMSQLSKDFSARYFPLTAEQSTATREWNWVLSPMPWEYTPCEGSPREYCPQKNVMREGGYQ